MEFLAAAAVVVWAIVVFLQGYFVFRPAQTRHKLDGVVGGVVIALTAIAILIIGLKSAVS